MLQLSKTFCQPPEDKKTSWKLIQIGSNQEMGPKQEAQRKQEEKSHEDVWIHAFVDKKNVCMYMFSSANNTKPDNHLHGSQHS